MSGGPAVAPALDETILKTGRPVVNKQITSRMTNHMDKLFQNQAPLQNPNIKYS